MVIKRIPYGSRLVTINEVQDFWKKGFHSVGVEIFQYRRNHVQTHPMSPRFIVRIHSHHNGFLDRKVSSDEELNLGGTFPQRMILKLWIRRCSIVPCPIPSIIDVDFSLFVDF